MKRAHLLLLCVLVMGTVGGRFSPIFTSWTAGELAPLMEGRVDFENYKNGAKTLENFIVHPQGPVSRRPGLKYIAETKYPWGYTRLVPFAFSTTQNYILEFGHHYIRFYREQGQITSGGAAYEVSTSYTQTDVEDLKFCQSADTLYIFHESHEPAKLTRTAHTTWTLTEIDTTESRGPFKAINETDTLTITPSATSGTGITLTASSALFDVSDHVGSIWQIDHSITTTRASTSSSFTGVAALETVETDFTATGQSTPVRVPDAFSVPFGDTVFYGRCVYTIAGTWVGTIVLQRSWDGGLKWQDYLSFTSNSAATNDFNYSHDYSCLYRWNVTAYTSGTIEADLSAYDGFSLENQVSRALTANPGYDVVYTITGTWTGTLMLQRSWDQGANWHIWESFTSNDSDTLENLLSDTVLVRWVSSNTLSGTATYTLSIQHTTTGSGYVEITAVASTTSATADVLEDGDDDELHSTSATDLWYEGAWSDEEGWPRCGVFFEDRLAMASSTGSPNTVWLSKTADYENFEVGTDADDAMVLNLLSREQNPILWMDSQKVLMLGSSGGIWRLGASTSDEALTVDNVNAKQEIGIGVDSMQPIKAGKALLLQEAAKRKILEVGYSWESDGFVPSNMTVLSSHIIEGGFVSAAYQQEPYSIAFWVRDDGELCALTYMPEHEVKAWSRIVTDGEFKSVASILGANDQHELWCIVEREIGNQGIVHQYIELMADYKPMSNDEIEDAFFVDSGLSWDAGAATSFTGLDHLIGETVSILADGAVIADQVVSNTGGITLDVAASTVHVGLPFTSTLEPMRVEGGTRDGTSQGKKKRIANFIVRFMDTVGAKVGPDADNLQVIPFRNFGDNMSTPIALYTGDKKVDTFPGPVSTDCYFRIVQDDPLPMTILSIMPTIMVSDL